MRLFRVEEDGWRAGLVFVDSDGSGALLPPYPAAPGGLRKEEKEATQALGVGGDRDLQKACSSVSNAKEGRAEFITRSRRYMAKEAALWSVAMDPTCLWHEKDA